MKYVIAGFGRFGRLALSRLSAAFPDCEFTVVDPNLDPCRLRDSPLVLHEIGDVVTYLVESCSLAPEDVILPMVPFHLAASYLMARQPEFKQVPLPEQIEDALPNPVWLSDSTVCCTKASFICPDDCPEGDLCAVTGEPREAPLYQVLETIHVSGLRVLVQRSFQILPGIGGYLFGDLIKLGDRVHQGPYIVATSCKCHAILTGIAKECALPGNGSGVA